MPVTPLRRTLASARAEVFRTLRDADVRLRNGFSDPLGYSNAVDALRRCAATVDEGTADHVHRVATYATDLARHCGWTGDRLRHLQLAATLHDIGKIAVPVTLLNKAAALSPAERVAVERHTTLGEALLRGCASPEMRMAQEVAAHHHERWDGEGYPHGLNGTRIPMAARLVALADVYDALTSDRPYRAALSTTTALAIIAEAAGTQFDPALTAAFVVRHGRVKQCA